MVNFVSSLESESISRVAFYRETTAFVNYLKEETEYTTVHVTGHSLGGGLALITGAQTNSSAVGLSAPNALLSRDTFDPPITKYQLDTLTFNIVPVRDAISMFDDLANLFQMQLPLLTIYYSRDYLEWAKVRQGVAIVRGRRQISFLRISYV